MKFSTILLTALLATFFALGPGQISDQTSPPSQGQATRTLHPIPPEPPSSTVEPGDRAPDFAYQTEDNRWHRLHDLLAQGPVFLVFGADPGVLTGIDRERDAILRLGVVPVAFLDLRNSHAWATARKLALRYLVVPDSRRVIAAQFNVVDANGQRTVPAWFVVDRSGSVRALKRGALPRQGFASRIAGAIGMPDPAAGVPAGTRR